MTTLDDTTLERIDLDLDGALAPEERGDLDDLAATSSELRAEREALAALHALLAADRVPVRAGFTEAVMTGLPPASWEARRSWRLPVALLLVFGVSAALLLAGADVLSTGAMGTALAVVDLFQAAVLAGAGLLGATWRGTGLALGEWLAASKANVAMLGMAVLVLNLVLVRMLRRRPAPQAAGAERGRDDLDDRGAHNVGDAGDVD